MEKEHGESAAKIRKCVQDTLMRVKIFYESKSVQEVIEKPKYEFSSIMSDIGGAISVYLGISLVSLFELVDIFIHGFAYSTSQRSTD